MTINMVHDSSIATEWLRNLSDYAYLSMIRISPEEFPK
jgi:hypothetical protein